jgi:hypothetical protein
MRVGRKQLAVRASDITRVLDTAQSLVLGSHFRATLPTGKMVKLLVAIQGQEIIKNPQLEALAHREVGISALELHHVYLPMFQEWGFVRVFDTKIEDTVKDRSRVLERTGRYWEESNPHPVENLGIDVYNQTALSPIETEVIENMVEGYSEDHEASAMAHLTQAHLIDKMNFKDAEWYYSPEVFGENSEKVIKYIGSLTEGEKLEARTAVHQVTFNQGIPHSALSNSVPDQFASAMAGAGILLGYPMSIGNETEVFYFTPELRSRFETEGRGDKFELIKTGISHFQYAYNLANPSTGRLRFNPYVLLDKLIETGKAGDATAIGTDYSLFVQKGLVRIERTSGDRCRFILPDSKDKIADLIAIRDSFKDRILLPTIDYDCMGIQGDPHISDSLKFRSSRFIHGKNLAQNFMKDLFLT